MCTKYNTAAAKKVQKYSGYGGYHPQTLAPYACDHLALKNFTDLGLGLRNFLKILAVLVDNYADIIY